MNGQKKHFEAYYNFGQITLPEEVVFACSHPGPCDDDVKACMKLPEIKWELSGIDPEALRKELKGYGAWDEQQLANHADNLERILWIAACDIREQRFTEEA